MAQPNHYTDPGTQIPVDHDHLESQAYRHRTMAEQKRYAPPKVDEAVNSAFNRAQTETSNYVPPDLIAQITQNVIKQLQSSGLEGSTPVPPQSGFSPPPIVHQPVPLSPSTASGTSPIIPNRVYTPPSPHRHPDYPNHTSPSQSQSGYRTDGPQSPRDLKASHFSPPRRSSSPESPTSKPSDKPYTRPKGPSRLSTSKEVTTLERIWGQLFDEDSHPTARLGQFLRGLAIHIIEDYEPKHSIVITPNKMVKYYEDVRLSLELYPWSTVFDDEHSSISRMYRDLECQHHLVQERYDERPDIPGLTPVGFEKWVTLFIQAHPDQEFERLQKAALEMPISNPDDKKERFPKEISRRLFPGHEDRRIRNRIEDSISEHAAVDLPRRSSREEPQAQAQAQVYRDPSPQKPMGTDPLPQKPAAAETPPHRPSVGEHNYVPQNPRASVSFELPQNPTPTSTYVPPSLERERKPYSNIPAESAIDDTNPPMPPPSNPISIERERKPYSAFPGAGKQFEDEARKNPTKPRSESIAASAPKPSRSDSTARARPVPVSNPHPMETSKPEVHHHRAPSNAGRRRRSPSFSRGTTNDFRRLDGDIKGYQPSSYQPPSSFPVGGPPVETVFSEDDTRRYFEKSARERAERARRQADDDARSYGESPRRYDRAGLDDRPPPRRGDYSNEEDYYRASGRGGNGYDHAQQYGGPIYR